MWRMRPTQLGVLAAISVFPVASGGCAGASRRPADSHAPTTAQQVETLLAGIPQNANTLGSPIAQVTLRWFGDLECPFCKVFTLGALPSIIQRWVRRGQLRIEYLSMESATREPEVFKLQQIAALAAGEQDKLWDFIELFYYEQGQEDSGYVTEPYLQGIASQIPGLNLLQWSSDRNDPQLAGQVAADRRVVEQARFAGTPAFLIGPTGGPMTRFRPRTLTDPTPYDTVIEEVLGA